MTPSLATAPAALRQPSPAVFTVLPAPSASRAASAGPFAPWADEASAYSRDQVIFSEGDTASSVRIITSGMVRILRMMADGRRQIVGFLQPGDMLGLAPGGTYLYSAEAVTSVTLRRLSRTQFDTLLERDPELRLRLLAATATELQVAQEQMLLLGRKTAPERLASFLLHQARRVTPEPQDHCRIPLPMTRTDIADFLGLTMETVSRAFTRLKTAHLVRLLPDQMVELVDVEALIDLSEGGGQSGLIQ
ncbi:MULTISPECIES: cyclic nucleotide-binding domain-containing protein [Nitrospirillum]|uniref:CRP/FNR family transcriptional regulator n=1 Tax=Nitrospirillum amazonense TaxID=28077 RepID=A0A560FQU2_9PROT|nr:cyclic nucleotide-binding domain-containing protein [Nitrospirillum amazonense]MEC4594597.1 cyclic nucleotide-binding domain-containing protein [Nitrospirillum amazonense]TWB23982.1 CRP/FNR family transcriptional regulator [Nitrospirillum amazonense]